MKTPEEFVKEYYQLPYSKIETVRIISLIKCIERYKEYHDSEVKKLNIPAVMKSVCEHLHVAVDHKYGRCLNCNEIVRCD